MPARWICSHKSLSRPNFSPAWPEFHRQADEAIALQAELENELGRLLEARQRCRRRVEHGLAVDGAAAAAPEVCPAERTAAQHGRQPSTIGELVEKGGRNGRHRAV